MQRYLPEKKIERRGTIGRTLGYGGLAILLVGFLYSFNRPDAVNAVLIAALAGTLISQFGFNLMNRWGRHPRIDEVLDEALKGLDDRNAIFHYSLGADHALFGPQGVFAIHPRLEGGTVTHEASGWWVEGDKRGLLRRGGKRNLKDLEQSAITQVTKLEQALETYEAEDYLEVLPVIVFMRADQVRASKNSFPEAVHVKQLKKWLRRQPNRKSLSNANIKDLAERKNLT